MAPVRDRRDPALAQHAAILSDRALALPLSAGPGGAQGVHASRRRAGRRAQRSPHPWRLPPQPVDRLSAGLRDTAAPASRCSVVAEDFRPTRSMRRILDRNGDLVGEMRVSVPTSEQYSVFRSYLDARHRDGGMADMTVLDYAMMVEDSHVETRVVEYRRRGPRQRHQRPRQRRAARGRAHRRAQRRALDGLLVLRFG